MKEPLAGLTQASEIASVNLNYFYKLEDEKISPTYRHKILEISETE